MAKRFEGVVEKGVAQPAIGGVLVVGEDPSVPSARRARRPVARPLSATTAASQGVDGTTTLSPGRRRSSSFTTRSRSIPAGPGSWGRHRSIMRRATRASGFGHSTVGRVDVRYYVDASEDRRGEPPYTRGAQHRAEFGLR